MTKAGRKRKHDAKRKPCGRIATPGPSERVDANKAVVLTQRRRRNVLNMLDNPTIEGALGEAFFQGIVDEFQHRAGDDYNALVRRYASLKGIPMPTPRGQAFDRTFGVRLAPDTDDKTVRAIESTYQEAFRAVSAQGYGAIREVNAVCVHGYDVSAPEHLRQGLNALIDLWRLREDIVGEAPMTRKIRKWATSDARPTDREDLREKQAS